MQTFCFGLDRVLYYFKLLVASLDDLLEVLVLHDDSFVIFCVHVYIHLELILGPLELGSQGVLVFLQPIYLFLSKFLVLKLSFTMLPSHDVLLALWLTVGLNLSHYFPES